jgi:hypothetical protein
VEVADLSVLKGVCGEACSLLYRNYHTHTLIDERTLMALQVHLRNVVVVLISLLAVRLISQLEGATLFLRYAYVKLPATGRFLMLAGIRLLSSP